MGVNNQSAPYFQTTRLNAIPGMDRTIEDHIRKDGTVGFDLLRSAQKRYLITQHSQWASQLEQPLK